MHDDDEDADPTSIQASVPFTAEAGYGYYEVTWLHEGTRGIITLGLGTDEFELDKIPGWVQDSYGYHGMFPHFPRFLEVFCSWARLVLFSVHAIRFWSLTSLISFSLSR
jgi:hypothetical protein